MHKFEYRSSRFFKSILSLVICILAVSTANAQSAKINKKNIIFITYPGFPQQHSTWDDIGYNSTYNKVYVGVTNHMNTQVIYAYNVDSKKMLNKGKIADLAHLRKFQRQGKIHSKFIEGPKGGMYFSTDGGASREEYLMNHPKGYLGGFFMKWDPSTQKLTNLGMGLRFDSIKDIDIDPETGNLYGISYPQVHFLVYNRDKNKVRDLGRLGSSHVPRVLFTDRWGNCYYVDWRQRLVKYDKSKGKLIFANKSLPAFSKTPGTAIVTGITSYAKDPDNGVIYLVTYGAKLLAFHPKKHGIGRVEDLGGVANLKPDKMWKPYVPNLNYGDNGKLYYIVGGHGNFIRKNKTVLMEFDPKTRRRRIVLEFPVTKLAEATGSNIKDKNGNLYFAGRKRVYGKPSTGEITGSSTPFLIKFNPAKEVMK